MRLIALKSGLMRWSIVSGVATFLVVLGMAARHFATYSEGHGNVAASLNAWLLSPGYVVAELIAGLFLSGGIHSAERLFWFGAPASWLFYFIAGALFFCVKWDSKVSRLL